ncbi:MAG: ABC transporter permease [Chloroflexota bacterium]|nr:ABC transporter permease [Chloroflexota bacterium]
MSTVAEPGARVDRGAASADAPTAQVSAPARDSVADPYALLAQVPSTSGTNTRLLQTIPSALAALRANKGRSILTTLGIIIGVAAVIAIVALGEGASASVANQLAGLGTNLLTIQPGSTQSGGARTGAGNAITLKAADANAIAQNVQGLTGLSPVVAGNAQIIAGSQNWSTRVQAVTPPYLAIESWTIAQGTAFTAEDNTNSNNVAVLGDTVATNLFPTGQSPIGQIIRIRNVPFTVVGLLAAKGTTAGPGGDQDDTVLIPFQTGQVRLFGSQNINQIIVQVADGSQIDAATTEMTALLRQQHKLTTNQPADFTIRNNNDIISRVSSVSSTMTLLLGGVAAVSLVVGGIGIMNIMLVSVTERTREIGIRLAIGAQPGDVLAQFLVEAVVLSVLGGLIGILVGAMVALLLPTVAGWTTVLPWNAIGVSFGVSAAIGMFFGIYPARKASQLDPIVALRYE